MTDTASFELLRKRLASNADALRAKCDVLNQKRIDVYGRVEPKLLARLTARTEHNCIARDVVRVHDQLLFGYQVFIGLKRETQIADVFCLYRLTKHDDQFELEQTPLEQSFLSDQRFAADFKELMTYYKNAGLEQLRVINDKLLMLFRTGGLIGDRRVFRFAIEQGGKLTYIDNRGERDHVLPPTYDFEWIPATREHHVLGRHPHVNILDTVFVETIGGDLTVKIENNTESGLGIYSETVDDKTQALGDAEIAYADLRHQLLIRIKPYREETTRYLVYNKRLRNIARIDEIGISCVQLPEDHGIVFPGGYALDSGAYKRFADLGMDFTGFKLKRVIKAPNGEDVLYVFYEERSGRYGLLPYNLIDRAIGQPLQAHGYARFADGNVLLFVPETGEASRLHAMQLWRMPFADAEFAAPPKAKGLLGRLGNAQLVRALAELRQLTQLSADAKALGQFERLNKLAAKCAEGYLWLAEAEAESILPDVQSLGRTAKAVLDAYSELEAQKAKAQSTVSKARASVRELCSQIASKLWQKPDDFVDAIVRIKRQRGELTLLGETPHVPAADIATLDQELAQELQRVGERALKFFADPASFEALRSGLKAQASELAKATGTSQLKPVEEALDRLGESLDGLTQLIGSFDQSDPQQRALLLAETSKIFADTNRLRAELRTRKSEFATVEQGAEFQALLAALEQSVSGALTRVDQVAAVDDAMAKCLSQIEQLETRFGEQASFANELLNRRETTLEAFAAKRTQLQHQLDQRATTLKAAIQRVIEGVPRRLQQLKQSSDIHAFFASDSLLERARAQIEQLRQVGRAVDADELAGKLKSLRESGLRDARDRADLGTDGNTLKLGKHRFTVANRALDLAFQFEAEQTYLSLTGTDYRKRLEHPELVSFKTVQAQALISESAGVYRGEYFAYRVFQALQGEQAWGKVDTTAIQAALRIDDQSLAALLAKEAAQRVGDDYQPGVHDQDAAKILRCLQRLSDAAGSLAMPAAARMLAQIWLQQLRHESLIEVSAIAAGLHWLKSHAQAWQLPDGWVTALRELANSLQLDADATSAAMHVIDVLGAAQQASDVQFPAAGSALDLAARIEQSIPKATLQTLRDQGSISKDRLQLAVGWAQAVATNLRDADALEAAVCVLLPQARKRINVALSESITGLLGEHPRLQSGALSFDLAEFLQRLRRFADIQQPLFKSFQRFKQATLQQETERMKLHQLRAKPLAGFVRNRLIDEVYLPLIGNNLAKQIGTLDDKRADRSGMLLLISPPGYGKTTLMEYLADRLGMIFVRINGPTLGHEVVALDPAAVEQRAAQEELEKLNLGLAMGNNVMLYLDDIQHLSPEFLQKFISLSDATRRIDAVLDGQAVSLDLRGKRFAIVMAGNPYTESGEVFRIPDMLANRADVYNLGDVLSGREALFADSYVENTLSAHPSTAGIADQSKDAVLGALRFAAGISDELPTEFAQSTDGIEVLKRMVRVRDVLAKVNAAYVASSAQDDAFRTEPPFKLQGSYRNMVKLTAQLSALMTDHELAELIRDHYRGEAQTLGARAEENLLKLAHLIGSPTDAEKQRWTELIENFQRVQMQGGKQADGSTKIANLLSEIAQQLQKQGGEQQALTKALSNLGVIAKAGVERAAPQLQATPQMQEMFSKLTTAYEETLLPLVSALHHKMTLDHSIWEQLRTVRTDLDAIVQKAGLKSGKKGPGF